MIELLPIKFSPGGIDPDSDQGLTYQEMCSRFECQEWVNGVAVAPKLVLNAAGFRCCPKCRGSYGKGQVEP